MLLLEICGWSLDSQELSDLVSLLITKVVHRRKIRFFDILALEELDGGTNQVISILAGEIKLEIVFALLGQCTTPEDDTLLNDKIFVQFHLHDLLMLR